MGDNSHSWLANRICQVHKTQLVYIDKHKLGCTGKVGFGQQRIICPHIEYVSAINPDAPSKAPVSIVVQGIKHNKNKEIRAKSRARARAIKPKNTNCTESLLSEVAREMIKRLEEKRKL